MRPTGVEGHLGASGRVLPSASTRIFHSLSRANWNSARPQARTSRAPTLSSEQGAQKATNNGSGAAGAAGPRALGANSPPLNEESPEAPPGSAFLTRVASPATTTGGAPETRTRRNAEATGTERRGVGAVERGAAGPGPIGAPEAGSRCQTERGSANGERPRPAGAGLSHALRGDLKAQGSVPRRLPGLLPGALCHVVTVRALAIDSMGRRVPAPTSIPEGRRGGKSAPGPRAV